MYRNLLPTFENDNSIVVSTVTHFTVRTNNFVFYYYNNNILNYTTFINGY